MRNGIRSFGIAICLTLVFSGQIVSEDRTVEVAAPDIFKPDQTVTREAEFPGNGPHSEELEIFLRLRESLGGSPLKGSSLYTADQAAFAEVLGKVMDSSDSESKDFGKLENLTSNHLNEEAPLEFANQPEQMIQMLRSTSDKLDQYAATLERKNSYKLADRLRRLAKKNRLVARSVHAQSTE